MEQPQGGLNAARSAGDTGVIELRLRDVRQLFNSMDPSPFHERDLDSDAEEFIFGWAMELPSHVELKVRLHLAQPPDERHPPAMIEEAIHHYFDYKAQMTLRRLRQQLSRGRLSLLIGTVFLALCLSAADFLSHWPATPLYHIMRESFIIVGWVAMWGPIEIFLYSWWPIRHEYRVYQRLGRAKVRVLLTGS